MKNNLDEKLIIRILLALAIFFGVFIVSFQLLERNMITVPERIVMINSSEVNLPESIKDKIEIGEFKININTAEKEEFEQIPGIGEMTAQRIIDYRNEHGKFEALEELMEIPRIGEKIFKKILPYIYL